MRLDQLSAKIRRYDVRSVVLGALAGLLLGELGLAGVLGNGNSASYAVLGAVLGLVFELAGIGVIILAVDLVLLAAYLTIALTPVIAGPLSRWVREDPAPRSSLDAVVVLSSGVRSDSALSASAVERLLSGMELVKAGVAPRLVTTAEMTWMDGRVVRSRTGQSLLVHLAGLDSMWSTIDSVKSTRDEAVRVAAHLLHAGMRKIALVTSPLHTRRACASFEAVGFQVYCVAARETELATRPPVTVHDRLAGARSYLHERLGMVKYRWMGWIATTPTSAP